MTERELREIQARASHTSDPLSRWDQRLCQSDRRRLLLYVQQLLAQLHRRDNEPD